MPRRILYCEDNVDGTIGGSHLSLLYLVEGLDRERFEPHVLFFQPNSLIPDFRAAGAEVHVVSLPSAFRVGGSTGRNGGPLRRVARIPFAILQKSVNLVQRIVRPVFDAVRFIRRHEIDLVHLNNGFSSGNCLWLFAARLTRTPCVVHERGDGTREQPFRRFLGKRVDAIACVSCAVRDNLVRSGLDPAKIVVIWDGIDPERIRPDRTQAEVLSELGFENRSPVIGIVANVREWKGQEVVVRATDLIRREFPEVVTLVVGDTAEVDRWYEERILRLVDELDLGRNVVFTGYRERIGDYLGAMDVVIHASVTPEPFGRVLIEGMALRKPVVGARAGAIPEVLDDGIAGLTHTPGDAEELAERVLGLLRDPEGARVMGNRGYERVMKEFHIRRNVDRTELLYARCLGEDEGPISVPLIRGEARSGQPARP